MDFWSTCPELSALAPVLPLLTRVYTHEYVRSAHEMVFGLRNTPSQHLTPSITEMLTCHWDG
jgi:hypothetical protein